MKSTPDRVNHPAALEFENVSFELRSIREGSFRILEDVSFRLEPGKFYCLLGPSGCGKTTTLTLAAGFAEPTRGRVEWTLGDTTPATRLPTMVFQEDTVFRWMTLEQNLEFARRHNRNRKATDADVGRLLDLAGLSRFRHFYPRELSGGMRKRVELCRAWLTGSDLLLDEPLGQLDYFTRKEQQQVLQTLWLAEPRTILMVSHDIAESLLLADVILVMNGPPAKIVRAIEIPFTRPRTNELRYADNFVALHREIENLMGTPASD